MKNEYKIIVMFLILSGIFCLGIEDLKAQERNYGVLIDEALDTYEENKIRRFRKGVFEPKHLSQKDDVMKTGDQDKEVIKVMIDVLDFKNVDIMDVLKVIAKKSNLNIVAGRGVAGKVNIYLQDVEVREALKIILESQNLTFAEEGNILRVMTAKDFQLKYGHKFGEKLEISVVQLVYADALAVNSILTQMKSVIGKVIVDKSSNSIILIDTSDKVRLLEQLILEIDAPRITQVFELYYGKVEDVAPKVTELLTKNIGRVEFDVRSNKLIVTDVPEKILQVEKLISTLDDKEKVVFIEAKILQVVLSDQQKMGVDWEGIVANYKNLNLKSNFDVLESSDKRGTVSVGTLSDDNYTALLEALEEEGATNILSNPRITVTNNNAAKILVGSTEPYITSTTITPSSGPTTTSESVNFIEVGVKLYVTPTIHRGGFITMNIKPEVSSVIRTVTTSNNNTIPVVETSEAETTVMVKDGVTIVIGGLIKDETIDSEKKIPLLGDIPLLGRAFKNTNHFSRKTELVIFLTPKIVSGDVDNHIDIETYKSLSY
ncbi:hypothetical protein MNBD_UNCLBAC01-984 [hydrothermal vent metagenome]|uniref:Secretin/TonB short N-terminal domain-containing protein n=1 Tax=hydrothermal vent metagenome TaxID=652676 RepID=A0A3B1DMC0_9ZZZZ